MIAADTIQAITDFADQAVILPAALVAAVGFTLFRHWRAALVWCAVVPATLASVAVAKIAVAACGGAWAASTALRSPSGHTASAALVYGGLAATLMPGSWRVPRAASILAAACVIGATRLLLAVHTPADVVAGAALGVVGAGAMAVASRSAGPRRGWAAIAGAVLLAALAFHGHHLAAETQLGRLSIDLWPFSRCAR